MNAIMSCHDDFVFLLILLSLKFCQYPIYYEEIFVLQFCCLRLSDLTLLLARKYLEIPHFIKGSIIKTAEKNDFALVYFN